MGFCAALSCCSTQHESNLPTSDDTTPDIPPPIPTPMPIQNALQWPETTSAGVMTGSLSYGHTHVTRDLENRLAPRPVHDRDTLILFTPDSALSPGTEILISAWRGTEQLGVLPLAEPDTNVPILEQSLTATTLEPYTQQAYSVVIPWTWMREDTVLQVAALDPLGTKIFEHTLSHLAPPHQFTITRSHIVLFDHDTFEIPPSESSKIAYDFYPTLPSAALRWVDTTPLRLQEVVIPTKNGTPMLVRNETEFQANNVDPHHWVIIKNIFTLAISQANIGGGLTRTTFESGDSSPYSFGTSVGSGWFCNANGLCSDIDDAPWAAGWTGWSSLWNTTCGNGFIHEVGHSMTLNHFTEGTAHDWGIDAEYPNDGVNGPETPWGYDALRRVLRTWYRVGTSEGKRDPMNGGEEPNGETCFPQYTPYHALRIQNWMMTQPTLGVDTQSKAAVLRWNANENQYRTEKAPESYLEPVAVDVPVTTIIGVIANQPGLSRSYPPIYAPSGNVFAMPDPTQTGHSVFNDARYFLEIQYADNTIERALIDVPSFANTDVRRYSINLDSRKKPRRMRLFRTPTPYPAMQIDSAELLHTLTIEDPPTSIMPPMTLGLGFRTPNRILLEAPCEKDQSCLKNARSSSIWQGVAEPLSLIWPEEGSATIPVRFEPAHGGEATEHHLPIRVKKIITSYGEERSFDPTSSIMWGASPDLQQRFEFWVPYEEISQWPLGRYVSTQPLQVHVGIGTEPTSFASISVSIDMTFYDAVSTQSDGQFLSEAYTSTNSSVYFLPGNIQRGPIARVSYNDENSETFTRLRVGVTDNEGASHALWLRAQHVSCSYTYLDVNAGDASRDCPHRVRLWIIPSDNPDLSAGKSYHTPAATPLLFHAHRWHDPESQKRIGTFAVQVVWQKP